MSIHEEDEIVNGFITGNGKVIKAFYEKHFPEVKNLILNNSGTATDAEDVFQDALVLTYQKLREESLKLTCSLSTYIYATSRYIWMNRLRKRKKIVYNNELIKDSKVLGSNFMEYLDKSEKQVLFQKYFLTLGDTCQRLLNYFFSGKKMKFIAASMNFSEGYTRKKKFECKKQLIEMIEVDPTFKELRNDSKNEKCE